MIPRNQPDIGAADLLAALGSTLVRPRAPGGGRTSEKASAAEAARVEALWPPDRHAIACLSVRSAFDLLLRTLQLPAGAEVIFSAITIRDMPRIAEAHGLVPVPADVEPATLAVDAVSVERAMTDRTALIVAAHLFGSRMPLDTLAALARARGVLLVEDCAQSFTGIPAAGSSPAALSLYSFGPIKTATALGGAVALVRDAALADAMRARLAADPLQDPRSFRRRVLKYLAIRAAVTRPGWTAFTAACRAAGRSHDEVISAALRGFPGPELLLQLRQRPCSPLLRLVRRRLVDHGPAAPRARAAAAERLLARLPEVRRPGSAAAFHSHWVVPVLAPDPDTAVAGFWRAGIDATRGASSLHVVPVPRGNSAPEPAAARALLEEVLYLPAWPGLRPAEVDRVVAAAEFWCGDGAAAGGRVVRPDAGRRSPAARFGASHASARGEP
jgi:perosamine synthetase